MKFMLVILKMFVDRLSPQYRGKLRADGHPGPAVAPPGDVHHEGIVERRRTRRAARDHHPNAASRCRPACVISDTRSRARPVATAGMSWAPAAVFRRCCSTTTKRSPCSVALRDLSAEADPTLGEAALSASAKLRQVLPAPLRDRVDALGEVLVGVRRTRGPARRRARRAAEPDDLRDGVPPRRPSALHLPRRCRPRERTPRRAPPARVTRPTLVSRRVRPRSRRLAHVPHRPSQRVGHVGSPQHAAPDARRCRARRRGSRRARSSTPAPASR